MSFRDDDNENKDDGSVWTSYSDMFTTMAVIFLVMFVFALLRSGVSTLTMVKNKKAQQEKLKGKIPEETVKSNEAKKKNLEDSIKEMDQFNNVINEKLAEINSFSKKMKVHKESMHHLLKDQAEKEAIVSNLREDMLKKDHKLVLTQQEVGQLKNDLNTKVVDLEESLNRNRNLKIRKEELSNQIKEWEKQVVNLKENFAKENKENLEKIDIFQRDLSQKQEENKLLAENLESEKLIKEKRIEELRLLEQQSEREKEKLLTQMAKLNEDNSEVVKSKDEELNQLNQRIFSIKSEKEKFQEELTQTSKLKEQEEQKVLNMRSVVAQLEKNLLEKKSHLESLKNTLNNSDQTISKQTQELVGLKSDLEASETNNNKLDEVIKNLNNDIKTANSEISNLKENVLNKNIKHKELKFKLSEVSQKLTESKNYNSQLNDTNSELNNLLENKKKQHHLTQEKLTQSEVDNLNLEKQINNLGFNVDSLQKQITSKENRITSLKNDLIKMEEDNSSSLVKNSSLKKMVKNLKSQIGTLELEVGSHKSQQVILNKNLASVKSSYKTEKEKSKSLTDKIADFKNQENDMRGKVRSLSDSEISLKNQLVEIQNKNSVMGDTNESLNEKISELQGKYQQTLGERKGLQNKLTDLNGHIDKLNGEKTQLHNRLADLQSNLNGNKESNTELNNKVANFQNQINNMNEKMVKFKYKCETEKSEKENLMAEVDKLKQEKNALRAPASLVAIPVIDDEVNNLKKENLDKEEQITMLLSKQRFLENQLKYKPKPIIEKIKVIEKVKETSKQIALKQKTLRQHIGKKIADRLTKEGLNVTVDPTTGSVILRMDGSFTFKRNSAELKPIAKKTLQKIIPLYSEEIFKDPEISNKIHNINIIGHASPRHRQKFVDPSDTTVERAYNFNLDLSSDRASEIVKYIFGDSFGKFSHKSEFRRKVQAIGKSFSQPIKRAPAAVVPKNHPDYCGEYDCKLSRRVEIAFTLKDDKEVWDKIQTLQEKQP